MVVDTENTSGFGHANNPALVAIYTLATAGRQALASSLDDGYTWTKYQGNPVLDRSSEDFRDPKVFRYQGDSGSYWVMVAVEARDRQVVFYRSDNLIDWAYLSSYGPAGAVGGVWECPDLFALPLDGDFDDRRWVLIIILNPGSIAGGSGTQYIVGHFDGTVFHPEDPLPPVQPGEEGEFPAQERDELEAFMWFDHGRDCYAGVTFSGLPDDERILIAWMSNSDYAHGFPTSPWRGAMTLPRRLELVTADGRPALRQTPMMGSDLRSVPIDARPPLPVSTTVSTAGVLDLDVRLDPGAQLVIELTQEDGGGVMILLDEMTERITSRPLVRPDYAMPVVFESVQHMHADPRDGIWSVRICFDAGSVELFTGGGLHALTDLACLDETPRQLTIRTTVGAAGVQTMALSECA